MTNLDVPLPPVAESHATLRGVQWSAAIVGAVVAAAVAFVLHSFALAIGLGVSSTAPTWRDASIGLILLSALYLFLVAFVSYGVGGYLAGRLRARLSGATTDEVEYVDGVHGILAWAIATLLAGLLALGAVQAASRLAGPSVTQSGAGTSVAGENIIAFDLDRLFRSERPPVGDISYARAEAARILLTTASHRGLQEDDRAALVRLVSARTGLAPAEAERRVNDVASLARQDINRARRSLVLIAFAAGVAALLGAAVAWAAACAGGRDRDGVAPRTALSEWWHRPFSLRT
ncbi:MAG: hypothetical protein JO134_19600 [Xanthobacteraceae bacterium]|nr:hypothetical protein [Xanthobacteraceae bacterium]